MTGDAAPGRLAWAMGLVLACGCAGNAELLAQLERASTATHLPRVVACWEREFEAAGFSGRYDAVVSFTVEADSGEIREARVDELLDTSSGSERPAGAGGERFEGCLVKALDGSSLAAGGLKPSGDLRVEGMRIAFRGDSGAARAKALESASNVLIGPRADRCQGMYDYDPPRDTATLFGELDDAQNQAERDAADPDKRARGLQRAYDVALELSARLRLDLRQDLPDKSRARVQDALRKARESARTVGAKIGCTPRN